MFLQNWARIIQVEASMTPKGARFSKLLPEKIRISTHYLNQNQQLIYGMEVQSL